MKHFLLFMSMLLIGSISFAADTTNLALYKEVKADVSQTLAQTFKTLEGPAKHAYEVTVKQKYLEGILDVILFPIAFLIALAFLRWFIHLNKHADSYGEYEVGIFISGMATLVMFAFTVAGFYQGIGEITNPEYFAIKEILTAIK